LACPIIAKRLYGVISLPRGREVTLRGRKLAPWSRSDFMRSHVAQQGFTMIELLVSMVLFVTIVSIVSGIFITSIRTEKQIVALIAANDNTFQALEQMSRAIRVGRSFNIPSLTELDFLNPQGERVHYRYNGSAIEQTIGDASLDWKKFTADNVNIGRFEIRSRGEGSNDGEPTRITLILSVGAKGAPNVENIFTHIQTTTTVRNLDQ